MGTNIDELLALGLSERTWIRNLPASLADLVRLIGVEPTLRLALRFGGAQVHIPKSPYRFNQQTGSRTPATLVALIGEQATMKLCAEFPRISLQLPSCLHGRLLRRLRWLSFMENGMTEREAAQAIGISRSTHYEWKRLYLEPAA